MCPKPDSFFLLLTLILAAAILPLNSMKVFASPSIPIDTIDELQMIGNDPSYPLDGYYYLSRDIDASETADWNDDGTGSDVLEGFEPIGFYESDDLNEGFYGVFDGQGHVITGLTINRPTLNGVGIFAYIDEGGKVFNLALANVNVVGQDWIGGLVGVNGGSVTDCSAMGQATSTSSDVGVLCGFNGGIVTRCHSSGKADGLYNVGGLLGGNTLHLTQSYSNADVTGVWHVAGLTGYNNDGFIKQCFATGEVHTDNNGGGLIGRSNYESSVEDCYATGNIHGGMENPMRNFGGLIGNNRGDVTRCFATGNVTGYNTLGGLLGRNEGVVTNCFATGSVTRTGPENVGGLVGYHDDGQIRYCYAVGAVQGLIYSGGLVGFSYEGTVSHSFWDVTTTGMSSSPSGGSGLSTAEMMQEETFIGDGWDFASVWTIEENITYPELRFMFNPDMPKSAVVDWSMWE